jgi:hypothetical protein
MMTVIRLVRIASLAVCLIVVAWFIVFAADRTRTASNHQQEVLASTAGAGSSSAHPSGVRHDLEEAGATLTAPFGGLVSASKSEWADHGIRLLAAMLVYGFGIGYLVRVIRVRT